MTISNVVLAFVVVLSVMTTLVGLWLAYKLQQSYKHASSISINRFLAPQALNLLLCLVGLTLLFYTWLCTGYPREAPTRIVGSVKPGAALRVYAAVADEPVDTTSSGFDFEVQGSRPPSYRILVVQGDRIIARAVAKTGGGTVLLNFTSTDTQPSSTNPTTPKEPGSPTPSPAPQDLPAPK